MVKLVDAFIEVYGRAPTMKELDNMAALQQDSSLMDDLRKRVARKAASYNDLNAAVESYAARKPKGKPKESATQWGSPRNAKVINRMLMRNLTVHEIGFYLELSDSVVRQYMTEWSLPRKLR